MGRAFVAALAVVLAFCFWRYSYFPGGGEYDTDWLSWTEHEENLAQAVALVPPGIEVDATRRAVPHIAHRPEVFQFPSTLYAAPMRPDLRAVDLFLFDLTDSQTRRALDATDQDTVLTRSPRFVVRVWGEAVLLLTRDRPIPSRPADAAFGALRLFGADLEQRPGRVRLTAYLGVEREAGGLDADRRAGRRGRSGRWTGSRRCRSIRTCRRTAGTGADRGRGDRPATATGDAGRERTGCGSAGAIGRGSR